VVREAGALRDWTNNAGVVGIDQPVPTSVSAAVADTRNVSPDVSVPSWDDVVAELLERYGE
jgi:carboxypeptidase C (cathepsin A)